MEMVALPDGRIGPYGNNPTGRYSVSVKTGEAYKDSRNAQRESMIEMLNYVGSDYRVWSIDCYECSNAN